MDMLTSLRCLILLVITPFICLLPDITLKFISDIFYPSPMKNIMREQARHPKYNFWDENKVEMLENHMPTTNRHMSEIKNKLMLLGSQSSFNSSDVGLDNFDPNAKINKLNQMIASAQGGVTADEQSPLP